jgi:hypothetical protein
VAHAYGQMSLKLFDFQEATISLATLNVFIIYNLWIWYETLKSRYKKEKKNCMLVKLCSGADIFLIVFGICL